MDVGFGHLRQVVVEYVAQLLDIDAPGGDIGGDQHRNFVFLKLLQGGLPGRLGFIPMDGQRRDTLPGQLLDHPVGAVLGAGKHQGGGRVDLLEQVGEQLPFLRPLDKINALVNLLHRCGRRGHRNGEGIVHHRLGQLGNLRRHGGGEKQVLAFFRQMADDPAHVMNKAHVQHTIGLVEDENFHMPQLDVSLTDQVVEPAWCGHQDVDALAQCFHLGILSHAAVNDGMPQR